MRKIASYFAFCVFAGSPLYATPQFTNVSLALGLIQEKEKSWGNRIWGDINNDGYLDLIIPTHGLLESRGPFVYLNNQGISFSDIRATCGIGRQMQDDGDWHGYAFGDYDGDGNLDLYITEGAKAKQGGTLKRDLLFRGNGDGTFTYVSPEAGILVTSNRGRCAFWLDYDNDGVLDLFSKNYDSVNLLYKGNAGGTLTLVPGAGGLDQAASGTDNGSIISFADYDNDDFMGALVTGDGDSQELYHNEGNGTFVDVTESSGLGSSPNGKGIAWGDYDNDGYLDLFIARAEQGTAITGISLYHNNGDGTFTDVTDAAGLNVTATCWSGVWGDYDNDGYLDLFVTDSGRIGNGKSNANFLFHNNGDGTFTNVAAAAGVALEDGHSLHKGAAWGDYDNDGFLDLAIKDGVGSENGQGPGAKGFHYVFRNNGNANHYLKLNLVGVQSNLRGIGARVTVTSAVGLAFREMTGGGGGENASQGSEPLHFGLGSATTATVVVRWPSGMVDVLHDVAADSTLTVTEGSAFSP